MCEETRKLAQIGKIVGCREIMKTIAATIILTLIILSAPVFAANPLENIPRGHWSYEALTFLAGGGLISLSLPPHSDTLFSRYEAALFTIQALEKVVPEFDLDLRRKNQLARITAITNDFSEKPVDIDLPNGDLPIMRSFLSGLAPIIQFHINEELITLFFGEKDVADPAQLKTLLKLVHEFAEEIDVLGFSLTDVELALLGLQHMMEQHSKLRTTWEQQYTTRPIQTYRLRVLGSYAPLTIAEYVLEFQSTVSRLVKQRNAVYSLRSIGDFKQTATDVHQNRAGVGELPSNTLGLEGKDSAYDVFDDYRFIDFKDINIPMSSIPER